MQPGSQRVTSELNSSISDLSGSDCVRMGCLDIWHKPLECACMSSLYGGLPTVGDAFINNLISHVFDGAEEWT